MLFSTPHVKTILPSIWEIWEKIYYKYWCEGGIKCITNGEHNWSTAERSHVGGSATLEIFWNVPQRIKMPQVWHYAKYCKIHPLKRKVEQATSSNCKQKRAKPNINCVTAENAKNGVAGCQNRKFRLYWVLSRNDWKTKHSQTIYLNVQLGAYPSRSSSRVQKQT